MAYDTQVAALKLNPLYQGSIEYRDYVDKLVALSDQQVEHLKQEEAHLMMLQAQDAAHHESLQRFQFQNESLVRGEDIPGNEVALTHQVALLNAILIEIASIQAETKVVQQRLLTQQQEARNLIMRMKQLEIESQSGDAKNLDQILQLTRNR
jgi:nicotinic acid phosphoribosyltransferase